MLVCAYALGVSGIVLMFDAAGATLGVVLFASSSVFLLGRSYIYSRG
jgi:hypothetical protein